METGSGEEDSEVEFARAAARFFDEEGRWR